MNHTKRMHSVYKLMAPYRFVAAVILWIWLINGVTCQVNIEQTYQVVGGRQLLQNLPMMIIQTTGDFFEPEESGQDFIVVNGMRYIMNKTADYARSQLRLDVRRRVFFPFHVTDGWDIIVISGSEGYRESAEDIFGQDPQQPAIEGLEAAWLMAMLKTELMANPLALLQMNLQGKGRPGTNHVKLRMLTDCADCPDINLWISPNSGLPERAQTLEGDWINGDVVFQVEYGNWTNTAGVMFPKMLTYRWHGDVLRREQVKNVRIMQQQGNIAFDMQSNVFQLKQRKPYDVAWAQRGYKSAQWFNRFYGIGEPTNTRFIGATVKQVADRLYKVDVAEMGYNSVVYDTPDGLYVVDTGWNADRSEQVLTALLQQFRGKRILGVVVTHMHYDHAGGLRSMAARADKVYVALPSAQRVKDVLFRTASVLLPDELSLNGRQDIEVVPVYDRLRLSSDPYAFDLIRLKSVSHASDFLAVYFPSNKMIVVADILNGGQVEYVWLLPPPTTREMITRGKQLLTEIALHKLDVQTVFTIHGGEVPLSELQRMAEANYENFYT